MKPRRKSLIIVGAALTLVFLLLLLLAALVSLDRYKGAIQARASSALGREVSVGKVRLFLFGGLGAEVQGIQVADRPGFGQGPFLTAESLKLKVALLPLLKGQVRVGKALLDRPVITLVQNTNGHWNIEDLLAGEKLDTSSRIVPGTYKPSRKARVSKVALLPTLALSELAIQKGQLVLMRVSREAGVSTRRVEEVDFVASQSSFDAPILFSAKARIREGSPSILSLDGKAHPLVEGLDLEAALGVRDKALPISLTGSASMKLKARGPRDRLVFEGEADLKPLGIAYKGVFSKAVGEEGKLRIRGRWEDKGLVLDDISLVLKKLQLEGSASIVSLRGPKVQFSFSSPSLELDKLLAGTSVPATGVARAAMVGPGTPTSSPESFVAQGKIRVTNFRWGDLVLHDLASEVLYHQETLRLSRLTASLYGGRLWADALVNLSSELPSLAGTLRLEGVRAEPFFKVLKERRWSLDGTLDLASTIRLQGWALGSAFGQGSLAIHGGRLRGYKPLERLSSALSPLVAPYGLALRLDEFDSLKGHFVLAKGFLRTEDLILSREEGELSAMGRFGLLDQSLDFDVTAKTPKAVLQAKILGTVAEPVVVPKAAHLKQRIKTELRGLDRRKGLKDLFRSIFK